LANKFTIFKYLQDTYVLTGPQEMAKFIYLV